MHQELAEVVAANTPVFYLHPRERFYPCTVEWFLQHARLAVMRNILLRRKVERGGAPLSLCTHLCIFACALGLPCRRDGVLHDC
jgi:hypothetical protein